jgi:7-keto-8-aminopelargonate synthetase-like enzyme
MDGDVADVAALATLARSFDASLVLDEAHAIGVIGDEGRGVAASIGVDPDVMIGTCGKALGTAGAFVATSDAIARLLWNRARPLVFSTAIPMAIAAATLAALDIVRSSEGGDRRKCVRERAELLRSLVPRAGGAPATPIVPIVIGDDRVVMTLMGELFEAGVYAQGIRPPTVPRGTARLRMSVSARHSIEDIRSIATTLAIALRRFT